MKTKEIKEIDGRKYELFLGGDQDPTQIYKAVRRDAISKFLVVHLTTGERFKCRDFQDAAVRQYAILTEHHWEAYLELTKLPEYEHFSRIF